MVVIHFRAPQTARLVDSFGVDVVREKNRTEPFVFLQRREDVLDDFPRSFRNEVRFATQETQRLSWFLLFARHRRRKSFVVSLFFFSVLFAQNLFARVFKLCNAIALDCFMLLENIIVSMRGYIGLLILYE